MIPSCDEDRLCVDLPASPWWVCAIAAQPVVYVTATLGAGIHPAFGCALPVRVIAGRFDMTVRFAQSIGGGR